MCARAAVAHNTLWSLDNPDIHTLVIGAVGEFVIEGPSPLNVLKDTYNHSCH